jgi:hypothetical protein
MDSRANGSTTTTIGIDKTAVVPLPLTSISPQLLCLEARRNLLPHGLGDGSKSSAGMQEFCSIRSAAGSLR